MDIIDTQRTKTKEQKHIAHKEVAENLLLHLHAFSEEMYPAFNEKAQIKLRAFIEVLNAKVKKVDPIRAHGNSDFFSSGSSQTEVEGKNPEMTNKLTS